MSKEKKLKNNLSGYFDALSIHINHYLLSVVIIGITVFLCAPLSNSNSYYIVSFILLFVVSFMATFLKTAPVLLASTLSALVWNFFFIPPRYTFHIEKTEDILMFGMFFIIALLNGILTTRVRRQEKLALDKERKTDALYQLTKELSKASGISEVSTVAVHYIMDYFLMEPFFILQDGNNVLDISSQFQKEKELSSGDCNAAFWVFSHSKEAGRYTGEQSDINITFHPLLGAKINPGVIAVKASEPIKGDKKIFWDTCITQISNALEREFLAEMAQRARFLDESDKLYKTLFNSISHELRIPVATILGSADTLITTTHPEKIQSALHHEIFTASLRLNRLIENLLNMSRLESGRISARLDWFDINDLVNKVSGDLEDELKAYKLFVSIPDNMPMVKIDFGLMEQVLYNLLFNSCEYAPASSDIIVDISHNGNELVMKIMDSGPGFPEHAIKNVFKKFFRVDGSKTGGLGLGLSIVKGFVVAHKGTITVENRKEGGAKFIITIPTEIPG